MGACMRDERLAHSGLLSLTGSAASALSALVIAVIIGNALGAYGTGLFFQAVGFFTIASQVLRLGTNSSLVRTISDSRRSDIVALYKRLFVGGNITVCFVGNFDGKKVMADLEKAFATAPPGAPPAPAGGNPVPLAADTLVSEERPYVAQSLAFGYAAPGFGEPDYPAFMIIDSYLRSGDRSPIAYWLQERRLAAGVGVLYPRYPKRSSIAVYLGATPANWKAARDTVAAVMRRLTVEPLDKGEWAAHLKRVQNGYFKDQDNPLIRARDLSRYETLGLGLDYGKRFETRLLGLKPEDVRDAAARWFTHSCEVTFLPLKVGSRP